MERMRAMALVAAGWLVAAGAAMGGSITSVAAPPTAVVGSATTITIQGRGPCSTVTVNYNTAGTATLTYPVASFPFSPPPHTYANPGPKTIQVTATGNCTGRVTTTISVATIGTPPMEPTLAVPPSLQRLCEMISCGPNLGTLIRPTLNGISPASISPGQLLMIDGSFLGAAPGRVQFRLPGGVFGNVAVTSWTQFSVTGTLDPAISGLRDGDAQVVVQRSDNVMSNAISIHFVAARQVVQVPRSFVTVSACGDDAVSRNCYASNDIRGTRFDYAVTFGAADEPFLPADPSASFSGFHQNYWDDGGCTGRDQYDLRLPEGWVIASFAPGVRSTLNATFHASPPIAGRRVGSVVVDWSLTGGEAHIFYGGWFFAAGPRGIPLGG